MVTQFVRPTNVKYSWISSSLVPPLLSIAMYNLCRNPAPRSLGCWRPLYFAFGAPVSWRAIFVDGLECPPFLEHHDGERQTYSVLLLTKGMLVVVMRSSPASTVAHLLSGLRHSIGVNFVVMPSS